MVGVVLVCAGGLLFCFSCSAPVCGGDEQNSRTGITGDPESRCGGSRGERGGRRGYGIRMRRRMGGELAIANVCVGWYLRVVSFVVVLRVRVCVSLCLRMCPSPVCVCMRVPLCHLHPPVLACCNRIVVTSAQDCYRCYRYLTTTTTVYSTNTDCRIVAR